jgi:hypothetical protein
VGVVHGLEREAGVIAVKIAVLDQILDSIDNLLELIMRSSMLSPLLLTFFSRSACSRRASNTLGTISTRPSLNFLLGI